METGIIMSESRINEKIKKNFTNYFSDKQTSLVTLELFNNLSAFVTKIATTTLSEMRQETRHSLSLIKSDAESAILELSSSLRTMNQHFWKVLRNSIIWAARCHGLLCHRIQWIVRPLNAMFRYQIRTQLPVKKRQADLCYLFIQKHPEMLLRFTVIKVRTEVDGLSVKGEKMDPSTLNVPGPNTRLASVTQRGENSGSVTKTFTLSPLTGLMS